MSQRGREWIQAYLSSVCHVYLFRVLFLQRNHFLRFLIHLVLQSVLLSIQSSDGLLESSHLLCVPAAVLTQLLCHTEQTSGQPSGISKRKHNKSTNATAAADRGRSVQQTFTHSNLQVLYLLVSGLQLIHLHRQPVLGIRQRLFHLLVQQPADRQGTSVTHLPAPDQRSGLAARPVSGNAARIRTNLRALDSALCRATSSALWTRAFSSSSAASLRSFSSRT